MRFAAVLALALLTVALAVPAAFAKDRQIAGGCSGSGDVCNEIEVAGGVLFLNISLAAKYFSQYHLCVKGPKSNVCKVFAIRTPAKAGDSYFSHVSWRRNFPYQGPGTYRVTWDNSPKPLTFRLPLS